MKHGRLTEERAKYECKHYRKKCGCVNSKKKRKVCNAYICAGYEKKYENTTRRLSNENS